MNHQGPDKANAESKKKWTEKFVWKRAKEHFGLGTSYKIFDSIDPTDVVMGSCNNCYMMAALAGAAESRVEELGFDEEKRGQRIRDNFITQEVNEAGCYALKFVIDGQERVVVVDDYFPFYKTKGGAEIFAFSKCKHGENELWV